MQKFQWVYFSHCTLATSWHQVAAETVLDLGRQAVAMAIALKILDLKDA